MNVLPSTVEQILTWADQHHEHTGKWPTQHSGVVLEELHKSWPQIDAALRDGRRGLPGGSSLPLLLAERRAVRNIHALPPLTEDVILGWADASLSATATGRPEETHPVEEAPGETWNAVDLALKVGRRGLAGGSSLAQLLAERRGHRNRAGLPPSSVKQILEWADAYHARHDQWPTAGSGPHRRGARRKLERGRPCPAERQAGLPRGLITGEIAREAPRRA